MPNFNPTFPTLKKFELGGFLAHFTILSFYNSLLFSYLYFITFTKPNFPSILIKK